VGEVAVAAVVGAAFEIVRRAGGGAGELGDAGEAGEVVGESWVVESLVGDAGEAVVGVMGESGASGGGVAHRGRFLEGDVDAAAGGVFDGLLGLVVEIVVPQAAAGTPHGGGVGHTGAGARATHPFERRTWPRSKRRTMEGGIDCGWVSELGRVYVCLRAGLDSGRTKEGGARERDQGRNVCAF
jgi:hypothetical protein